MAGAATDCGRLSALAPGDIADASYRLINSLADGTTSETAYDTALVSELRTIDDDRRLAFPSALTWLRSHQHADGSWGGRIEVPHDRLISTLAVMVRLCAVREPWAASAVQQGQQYLHRHATDWQTSPHETVAFEILVPHLLDDARTWELPLPYSAFDAIAQMGAEKLRRMPCDHLYCRPTTLVHSLEFLGDDLDCERVGNLRSQNGAFGNSPSATAFVLRHVDDPRSEAYLRRSMAVSLNGGACTVYPIEIFEKAWVLYNLGPAAQQIPGAAAQLAYLRESSRAGAIGMSREGLTADSDDTGMVHTLLHRQGEETNLDVLLPFEQEGCFSCFPYERNSSVGANAHVLDAFVSSWDRWRHAATIRKILAYLRSTRLDGAYWYDKWHLSPFYATSQVALAAREVDGDLVTSIVSWLLETQRADGSWGWFGGTCEETAYAMQVLLAGGLHMDSHRRAALDRGARYLTERFDDTDYPELWVGKSLYTPYPIVQAAVIGALQQYQTLQVRR